MLALQGDLEGLGPQAAHAGVLAAAVAIAADLARHRILDLLLCGPDARPAPRSGSRAQGPGLGSSASGGCGGRSAASLGDGSQEGARGRGGPAGGNEDASASAQKLRKNESWQRSVAGIRRRRPECRGWRLVLTGHSLGACCALLALKLRAQYPNLHCWAYGPPGGFCTLPLARAMRAFCTSVIVGKDAVPRASLHTASRLQDEVVEALARGRRCKARVLLGNLSGAGRRALARDHGAFCAFADVPREAREHLHRFLRAKARAREQLGAPMFPPGRIAFLRHLKAPGGQGGDWDAVWIGNEAWLSDLAAEGLLISSNMLHHHRIANMRQALEAAGGCETHDTRP